MRSTMFAITVLTLFASAANAQQRALSVPATSAWQHAKTDLILPPKLAGYPRTAISDATTTELDISASFTAPDQSTFITVYLFRPALMSVPVWFDRAEVQILNRSQFGAVRPISDAQAFVPPRAKIASALRRTYRPDKNYRSTALAILPLGDWLVAVRLSSTQLEPADAEARLGEVIDAIRWPQSVPESVAAVPVLPCPSALAYARKAKLIAPDMSSTLMGALLAGVADDVRADPKAQAASVPLCREQPGQPEYGVYRAPAAQDSYVVALGDAGRVVNVSPSLSGLVDGKRKGYALALGDLGSTLIYPDFDKLPSPEAAVTAVQRTAPVSQTSRSGKNVTITLPSK